ncbi:MAG: ElyC/SanA/YdcF family protein [Candidatus Marinimicrobia bacterium]|nr:ElyC/SanA/YdcF family protein [Candidatus Neomarinimicrobiota bacterium]
MKKFRKILVIIFVLLIIIITAVNLIIFFGSKPYLYDDINIVPKNRVGLVLGTSKYFMTGDKNPYFKNRIIAATKLYEYGKIKYIILSGDNSEKYYNEPVVMRDELIKYGVPEEVIYLDYAGFRTWDSVLRCNIIFGQKKFTIISQKFHNARAVYIARKNDIQAIGFNAADISNKKSLRTRTREVFARIKVFIDLSISKDPKYLGNEIPIK